MKLRKKDSHCLELDDFMDYDDFDTISVVPQIWIISKKEIKKMTTPTVENVLESI